MQVKYETDKEELFPTIRYPFDEDFEFEESAEEMADIALKLKSFALTGYVHKDELGHFQSKEFGFIGAKKEQAHRDDERGTSYSIQSTQEKT